MFCDTTTACKGLSKICSRCSVVEIITFIRTLFFIMEDYMPIGNMQNGEENTVNQSYSQVEICNLDIATDYPALHDALELEPENLQVVKVRFVNVIFSKLTYTNPIQSRNFSNS